MTYVHIVDGAFEFRWTWLPFWLATNPRLRVSLDGELKALVLLNGVTGSPEDLLALDNYIFRRLQEMFPEVVGLGQYLRGLHQVTA